MKQVPTQSTTPPKLTDPDDFVLPSQRNWLMKTGGGKQSSNLVKYEHILYSDAHITEEFRKT